MLFAKRAAVVVEARPNVQVILLIGPEKCCEQRRAT
jgi:hypothetical protein